MIMRKFSLLILLLGMKASLYLIITFCLILSSSDKAAAQEEKSLFEMIPTDIIAGGKPLKFGDILLTSKGSLLVANSNGVSEMDGMQIEIPFSNGNLLDDKGKKMFFGKNSNIFRDLYEFYAGIKLICEGPDKIIYVVSDNNNFGCINYNWGKGVGFPVFNFPNDSTHHTNITKIWIDGEGTLFAASNTDTIYAIAGATKLFEKKGNKNIPTYLPGLDKDSNFVVMHGARTIKKFSLGLGKLPYSFASDPENPRIIMIGTNNGVYGYDKQSGQSVNYFKAEKDKSLTVTNIEEDKIGSIIWFSTLEKGMGRFNTITNGMQFFLYPKKNNSDTVKYPINNFCRKSDNDFFVAIADSFPAIFNTETGSYTFITDPLFSKTENKTTGITADAFGNLFITKGGGFFWSKRYLKENTQLFKTDSSLYGPYITDITINGTEYKDTREFYERYESLKEINLKYNENKIAVYYSCRGINIDSLVFAWKLDNYDGKWTTAPFSVFGEKMNMWYMDNLKPGKYLLHIKAGDKNGKWLKKEAQLAIIISPPVWQTWWFWLTIVSGIGLIVFGIVKWRVNAVRKQERMRATHEKEILQLEAKALRSQMNPHFIFNCMNSIKSLIQKNENEKATGYLTIFSKLIRTIFQNSDKREITLYDEIETCRLYAELESMRFGNKLSYTFNVDEAIDLKSITVPALILQPFIENAIWHGIMPKEEGGTLRVNISKKENKIFCIVEDDGIGREISMKNKFNTSGTNHQSKGIRLTQSRLELNNLLNERNATVEIIDKTDENNKPCGTKVLLTFNEE